MQLKPANTVTQQISFHLFREQILCPAFRIAQMVGMAATQGLKELGEGELLLVVLDAVL